MALLHVYLFDFPVRVVGHGLNPSLPGCLSDDFISEFLTFIGEFITVAGGFFRRIRGRRSGGWRRRIGG